MTEEEIRAATIGQPQLHNSTIDLADYDPSWPELFKREADRIVKALRDKATAIEHVGSTSVPGLAAKPVIDILLAVADSTYEDAYVPPLESVGYVLKLREPEWHEHRLLKRDVPQVNLHVFSVGSTEIERMLSFRDRLRSNEVDRELYERAKRTLARRKWRYVQNYADAKRAVIEEILARARSDTSHRSLDA